MYHVTNQDHRLASRGGDVRTDAKSFANGPSVALRTAELHRDNGPQA